MRLIRAKAAALETRSGLKMADCETRRRPAERVNSCEKALENRGKLTGCREEIAPTPANHAKRYLT